MRFSRPLSLSALALAVGAPAAQSATLDPLRPCYRSIDDATRETVHVQAGGFTPGAAVNVSIDGVVVERDVMALPDGSVTGEVIAPHQPRGVRPFALTVTERDRPENAATALSRVTALSMRLQPSDAEPSSRVRFLGRGFLDGAAVYGHYLRGDTLRKTVLLGRPQGRCGRLRVKRRQIPVRRPEIGRWTLQVDNQPVYAPQPPGVAVRLAITVKRAPAR